MIGLRQLWTWKSEECFLAPVTEKCLITMTVSELYSPVYCCKKDGEGRLHLFYFNYYFNPRPRFSYEICLNPRGVQLSRVVRPDTVISSKFHFTFCF